MSFREQWTGSVMPATLVPSVIGAALAADVRARLAAAGYERYALLDRGSYERSSAGSEAALCEMLLGIASEVTGRALSVAEVRALRLLPGDYLLVRHDRVYDGRPIEVTLDLSALPVRAAEIHYRHRGQVFFVVPSQPGTLAVVERGPTVMANHTYVSRLNEGAEVVRLVLLLRAP
jgi:hypothetical protein